jgi:small neutral amino acid transporter SnatA (MarC family)
MVRFIKENGWDVIEMVMGLLFGQMGLNIKDNGKIIKHMEKESLRI